jgi:2,3-bisphosphoglycerate-independent phosphoglycerate mutase
VKYLLVIGDGMADAPVAELGGKTPLEALNLPHFNILAGSGKGTALTVPAGMPAGSDTAILNIFGYDPRIYYTGRSVLEAAGVGVALAEGDVSFRMNLCSVRDGLILSHNGGGVEGDEAECLMHALLADTSFALCAEKLGLGITVSRSFRHIGIARLPGNAVFSLTEPHNVLTQPVAEHMPRGAYAELLSDIMRLSFSALDEHPVNAARRERGDLPANMLWPWGAGRAVVLPEFAGMFGHAGIVVSAVPLVWGIAALAGLYAPGVPGANGGLDTNYEGKVDAALAALTNGYDFAAVHIEAPDEMAHAGDLRGKCEALRRLDARVIAPLLTGLDRLGDHYRILFLSDHYTLLSSRTHDGSPVPWALYDSRHPAQPCKFDEKSASSGPYIDDGSRLMPMLFERIKNDDDL